jgi:hypothetical protein
VITVSVSNATIDERIADANVVATVSHGDDFTSNFEGVTNSDGEFTFELNKTKMHQVVNSPHL